MDIVDALGPVAAKGPQPQTALPYDDVTENAEA